MRAWVFSILCGYSGVVSARTVWTGVAWRPGASAERRQCKGWNAADPERSLQAIAGGTRPLGTALERQPSARQGHRAALLDVLSETTTMKVDPLSPK